MEFTYNANGNLITDLDRDIATIKYNLLNLPELIQFKNGSQIKNLNAADGKKLSSRYVTLVPGIYNPLNPGQVIDGLDVNENDFVTVEGMDYIDNIEYKISRIFDWDVSFEPKDNISIKRVHNGEGYAEGVTYVTEGNEPAYSYYRRDHLGNNREVWCASYIRNNSVRPEKTMQRTQYYPSGLPWAESTGVSMQPYKHNGKEFIETHGYDVTDHGNRGIHHATNRYTTMDRFAEKFPWQSPYVHAGNNPVNYVDVNGDSINVAGMQGLDQVLGTSYTQKIINDLQAQTGLTYSISTNGNLNYNKDDNGSVIVLTKTDSNGNTVQIGSETARLLMIDAINHENVINVMSGRASGVPSGTNDVGLNFKQIEGFVNGAFNLDNRTLGWGMALMHEIQHTQVGGGLSDTPYNPGPVVSVMNKIRSELNSKGGNYGQRMDYFATPLGSSIYISFDRASAGLIKSGLIPTAPKFIKFGK